MKKELIAKTGMFLTQNDDRTTDRIFATRVFRDYAENWRDATSEEKEEYEKLNVEDYEHD